MFYYYRLEVCINILTRSCHLLLKFRLAKTISSPCILPLIYVSKIKPTLCMGHSRIVNLAFMTRNMDTNAGVPYNFINNS